MKDPIKIKQRMSQLELDVNQKSIMPARDRKEYSFLKTVYFYMADKHFTEEYILKEIDRIQNRIDIINFKLRKSNLSKSGSNIEAKCISGINSTLKKHKEELKILKFIAND